jgi:hypothetical protein
VSKKGGYPMAAPGKPFKKGQSGNPKGRPAGLRNRLTVAVDELLNAKAEQIMEKAIELALVGDGNALRLCVERITPARKDRPVLFELPPISAVADLPMATGALLAAVASGELTPSEAAEFGKLIEAHVRAVEVTDLAERVAKLEGAFQ